MEETKWCLILGVSSGIGRACARALSRDGCNVAGVHFDIADKQAQVDELERELRRHSPQVRFYNRNADNRQARAEIVAELKQLLRGRPLGLMLHSLAFGTLLPFIRTAPQEEVVQKAQLDMTVSVMAHSLVYWTQELWEQGLLGQGSKIFSMTSVGSVKYSRHYGAVSAAKCALESHTRQLAMELAPYGVSVNCIRAGVTDTPALRKIPGCEETLERARAHNPHGRVSMPEDVAEALRHFNRLPGSWMTGNVINVDGGEILTI